MEIFSALLALCEGNPRSSVDSPHKGQWRGALMFSLICAWTNGWANKREAGDLRRHCSHYDVTVMDWALIRSLVQTLVCHWFRHWFGKLWPEVIALAWHWFGIGWDTDLAFSCFGHWHWFAHWVGIGSGTNRAFGSDTYWAMVPTLPAWALVETLIWHCFGFWLGPGSDTDLTFFRFLAWPGCGQWFDILSVSGPWPGFGHWFDIVSDTGLAFKVRILAVWMGIGTDAGLALVGILAAWVADWFGQLSLISACLSLGLCKKYVTPVR